MALLHVFHAIARIATDGRVGRESREVEMGKVSKGIASDITHDAEFARELRLDRASLESEGLVPLLLRREHRDRGHGVWGMNRRRRRNRE